MKIAVDCTPALVVYNRNIYGKEAVNNRDLVAVDRSQTEINFRLPHNVW